MVWLGLTQGRATLDGTGRTGIWTRLGVGSKAARATKTKKLKVGDQHIKNNMVNT